MSIRHMAVALALALAAQPAFADNAKHRGSSSSGGSSGAARVQGSSNSHSTPSYRPSSSGGSRPGLTDAERRHPRPGTGTGYRGRTYYGYPYYYRSYYYPYWGSLYFGTWWPYDGFYASGSYGYPYSYPYGYRYRYRYRDTAAIRVLVDPDDTRVYVDGYYAGVADDFDGLFQRLHLSPGRHEIALKREGYRTHRIRVYVAEDSTLKIRYKMEKGSPSDETVENLAGDEGRETGRGADDDADRYAGPDADRFAGRDAGRDRGTSSAHDRDVAVAKAGPPGRLRLAIRPDDASVYVDGTFRGTAREVREIELPPGSHRVEVVRPGFRTEERDVEIDASRSRELDLELERR